MLVWLVHLDVAESDRLVASLTTGRHRATKTLFRYLAPIIKQRLELWGKGKTVPRADTPVRYTVLGCKQGLYINVLNIPRWTACSG
jgi:hypothetical protein